VAGAPVSKPEDYVAAVRALIEHLPTGEREEILEDLTAQLEEEAAEPGLDVAQRLGTPSAFAAEFVESLGVTRHATPTQSEPAGPASTRRPWADLRSTWWMLRPFLIIGALVLLVGRHARDGLTELVLVALGAVAAAASVAWSNRQGDAGGRWNLAWTAGGVASAVAVAGALLAGSAERTVIVRPAAAIEMKCARVEKSGVVRPPFAKQFGPGQMVVAPDVPPVCRRFLPFAPASTTTTSQPPPTVTTTP
jgi:HAAS domain-containing protein